MSSNRVLFRSELLFYVQNNVACVPRDIIICTLCGFYSDDEVAEAKSALFAVAASLPRRKPMTLCLDTVSGEETVDNGPMLAISWSKVK